MGDYWTLFWQTVVGAAIVIGIGVYALIYAGDRALVAIGGM
jgi:hypothetical protein